MNKAVTYGYARVESLDLSGKYSRRVGSSRNRDKEKQNEEKSEATTITLASLTGMPRDKKNGKHRRAQKD